MIATQSIVDAKYELALVNEETANVNSTSDVNTLETSLTNCKMENSVPLLFPVTLHKTQTDFLSAATPTLDKHTRVLSTKILLSTLHEHLIDAKLCNPNKNKQQKEINKNHKTFPIKTHKSPHISATFPLTEILTANVKPKEIPNESSNVLASIMENPTAFPTIRIITKTPTFRQPHRKYSYSFASPISKSCLLEKVHAKAESLLMPYNKATSVKYAHNDFPLLNKTHISNVNFPINLDKTENISYILNSLTNGKQIMAAVRNQTHALRNFKISIDEREAAAAVTHSKNLKILYDDMAQSQVHMKNPTIFREQRDGDRDSQQQQQQQHEFLSDDIVPNINSINIDQERSGCRNNFNFLSAPNALNLPAERNMNDDESEISLLKYETTNILTPPINENYEKCSPHSLGTTIANEYTNNNGLNHQQESQSSDVRETSVQKVLFALNTTPTCGTCLATIDCWSNLELLPNNFAQERAARNVCNWAEVDELIDTINTNVNDDTLYEREETETETETDGDSVSDSDLQKRASIVAEMTVTKVTEANEEENLNASLTVLCNNKSILKDISEIDEMKFEMKSVKGALPMTALQRAQRRNDPTVPSSRPLSANYDIGAFSTNSSDLNKSSAAPLLRSENLLNRTVSTDAIDSVLPTRTRLRRQRHLRKQNSEEKPEDAIERLNRLRARISGALSEVKVVLKQYSTDNESVAPLEQTEQTPNVKLPEAAKNDDDDDVVQFRFVRKVRRRSCFTEDEEDENKEMNVGVSKAEDTATAAKCVQMEADKVADNLAKHENQQNVAVPENEVTLKPKFDMRRASIAVVEPRVRATFPVNNKAQRRPSDSEAFIKQKPNALNVTTLAKNQIESEKQDSKADIELAPANVSERLENKNVEIENVIILEQTHVKKDLNSITTGEAAKKLEEKEEQVKEVAAELKIVENPAIAMAPAQDSVKPQRKVSLKPKVSTRRASIAAVERSKIEPPVSAAMPLSIKAQRRPSDSAAIIKKKVIKAKEPNALNVDALPKVKTATKVRRPSVKSGTSLSATQTSDNLKTAATIANNSNTNAALSIATTTTSEATKPKTNTIKALPTQLVIDDAELTIVKAPSATTAATDLRLATKLNDQQQLALVSASKTSEECSQTNAKQLAELVGETIVVLPNGKQTTTATPTDIKKETIVTSNINATKINEISQDSKQTSEVDSASVGAVKSLNEQKSVSVKIESNNITEIPVRTQNAEIEIKKPIDQQKITADSGQQQTQQNLQVSVDEVVAPQSATALSAVIKEDATSQRTIDAATKPSNDSNNSNSVKETVAAAATTDQIKMPELQVAKALQVFDEQHNKTAAPFNVAKDDFGKKKMVIRKIIRKNSIDKAKTTTTTATQTLDKSTSTTTKDKSKVQIVDIKNIINKDATTTDVAQTENAEISAVEEPIDAPIVEAVPPPPKKVRKIKKKVIIRRQQRRLSVCDTFFKGPEETLDQSPETVETLEKAIAYVTDSDEEQLKTEAVAPPPPLKSCIKKREYQIDDLVMYAERYKKTLVRWKKGRVLEKITGISYKLEIDGKEVPAHISYIKKYTERKVNFGGKEYLEIDYEQIAEEEEKARNYSIWNMV